MKHYSGFYFCSHSHWDGEMFDGNNVVEISIHDEEYGTEDFDNLCYITKIKDDDDWRVRSMYSLKDHVIEWLEANIDKDKNGNEGWCMGNDEYRKEDRMGVNIWFYRRKDTLAFIKHFSVYKKPTEYYHQHSYKRTKLNLKTNTHQPY